MATKIYKVQAPDGSTIKVEGPEGASEQEVIAQAQRLYKPAAKKPVSNKAGAGLRGFVSGITSNFDDELAAAANTVLPLDRILHPERQTASMWDGISPREAFEKNLATDRALVADDAKNSPKSRGAGTIAGGITQALLGAKAIGAAAPALSKVPGVTALARSGVGRSVVARAAAGGAASGAAAGAGAAEGSLETRRKSAALGGLTGAVLGGAVAGTVAGLSPVVKKYADAFLNKGVTQQALQQIAKALQQEGYDVTSPQGVQALQAELSSYAGKPVSLADIGNATRARTGVGLRTPSKVQSQSVDTVIARRAGQGPRLSRDITDTVAPRTDVYALDDALVEQRTATAIPLRQAALRTNKTATTSDGRSIVLSNAQGLVPVVPEDNVLQQIARLPMAQKALGEARGLAENERMLRLAQGQSIDDLPDFPDPGAPLDMKSLDYMKRYMDKQVDQLYRNGAHTEAAELKQLRDALRERMRTAVPEYGEYLDTYSDISSMRDALAAGRGGVMPNGRGTVKGFDQLDPEQIAAGQAGRSTAEQELYRVGVARNLDDTVRSTRETAAPANRILNTPESIAQLEATGVTPENVGKLTTAVRQERQLDRLHGELTGAQTDARLAARADADAGVSGQTPFNPTSPVSWLAFFGRKAAGAVDLRRNAAINEAALPRLLAQDPAAIQRTIQELVAAGRQQEADILRRAAQSKLAGAGLGNIIGAPVSLQEGN